MADSYSKADLDSSKQKQVGGGIKEKKYKCIACGGNFSHRQSLFTHRKRCTKFVEQEELAKKSRVEQETLTSKSRSLELQAESIAAQLEVNLGDTSILNQYNFDNEETSTIISYLRNRIEILNSELANANREMHLIVGNSDMQKNLTELNSSNFDLAL